MNKEEYEQCFAKNQKTTGYGIGNVHVHMPCPFCAAPDFLIYELLEVQEAMKNGAVCSECGRGSKALYHRTQDGVQFEIVQTCGDDAPDFLPPIRRIVTDA